MNKYIFKNQIQRGYKIIYLEKKEFDIYYSCNNKYPLIVIQNVNKPLGSSKVEIKRQDQEDPFGPDPGIPKKCSMSIKDYDNYMMYGGSPGHNAPAGQHKTNMSIWSETFLYSNMCPQEIVFNSGVWVVLETWIKRLSGHPKLEKMKVITGSIPGKKKTKFNGSFINVPSHMFKIVLCQMKPEFVKKEEYKNQIYSACFLYPNMPIEPVGKNTDINKYLTSLKKLSDMGRFNIFPYLEEIYQFRSKNKKLSHLGKVVKLEFKLSKGLQDQMTRAKLYGLLIYSKTIKELDSNWKKCLTHSDIISDFQYHKEYYDLAKNRISKGEKIEGIGNSGGNSNRTNKRVNNLNKTKKTKKVQNTKRQVLMEGSGNTNNNIKGQYKFGTEFKDLMPKADDSFFFCKNDNYTNDAIEKFKGLETMLNNIKLDKFDNSQVKDIKYVKNYIKNFYKQIFNNLSTKNYPCQKEEVPRKNHGGLNHLRSLKFGIRIIIDIFNNISQEHYKLLFKNDTFIVLLVLSTSFESIMRIDENKSSLVLCKISKNYFNKLYPNLSYVTLGNSMASPHQIASSVFFKVLMVHCFKDNKDISNYDIDLLSRGVSFHWSNDHDTIKIKELTLDDLNKDNNLKFFIYYVIIIVGHYLDHCRANFSNMIHNDDIKHLLSLFNIDDNTKNKLIKTVLQTLLNTEFKSIDTFDINTVDIKNKMMVYCNKLQNRYTEPKFKELSLDFEKAYTTLKIEDDLVLLLNFNIEKEKGDATPTDFIDGKKICPP